MGSETEDLRSNLQCKSPARPGAWPLRSICAFVLCLLSRVLERKQVGVVYSRSWCFSCFLSLSIEAMPQKICPHKIPIEILASKKSFWAQVIIAKVSLITRFYTKKKARWHLIALFRCLRTKKPIGCTERTGLKIYIRWDTLSIYEMCWIYAPCLNQTTAVTADNLPYTNSHQFFQMIDATQPMAWVSN